MGQEKPTLTPKIFAKGFISKEDESEFGSVFNKKATAFFYGVDVGGSTEIRYSELIGNKWSEPKTILSHEKYGFNDPFLSPDEKRLYFISKRALDGLGAKQDYDIWYVEKEGDQWSEPINAGEKINSQKNEYYVSFTTDGTMYFSSNKNAKANRDRNFDIYYSSRIDGEFMEPIKLNDSINTKRYEADVFIAPDERYMIFCSIRKGGYGQGDLYISFKKDNGNWTHAKNMGESINNEFHQLCPFVSKDGKYLFFTSNQDIYWVDAKIIEGYK